MKIIYLLLLLGFISCTTQPTEVYDMYYNYEYELTKYQSYQFSYYIFRLPVNPSDKMDFEFKIPKNLVHDFKFNVYSYKQTATDEEAISRASTISAIYLGERTAYEENGYVVYPYTFQAYGDSRCFIIEVTLPSYDYTYILFRVNVLLYKYSNIKDLDYNIEYTYDTSIFGDQLIPQYYQIYIRVPAWEDDDMEVQLTTHASYNQQTAFSVEVCQYSYKPTEKEVYYPDQPCSDPLENTSGESMKYIYPFRTAEEVEYLSIRITNNEKDLAYLYIYIYSEKGLAAAIIALIVILPLLVVGAIIYFILKKLGICK